MAQTKPSFKHPNTTSEGRVERAVFVLKDGARRGLPVTLAIGFLQGKGCTDDEMTEALNQASIGGVTRAALGW